MTAGKRHAGERLMKAAFGGGGWPWRKQEHGGGLEHAAPCPVLRRRLAHALSAFSWLGGLQIPRRYREGCVDVIHASSGARDWMLLALRPKPADRTAALNTTTSQHYHSTESVTLELARHLGSLFDSFLNVDGLIGSP